jgi:hypothetical protein
MSSPSYDDVTRWLIANHKVHVSGHSWWDWQCSCGAQNAPGTRLTERHASANADRHRKAMRRRFPACRYCQREARVGDICDSCHEDAKDMSR